MKRVLFFLLAWPMIGISTSAQTKIDGQFTDWNLPLSRYDAQAHVQYDVKNDDSSLYICIRFTEPKFQMKVCMAGMTVYIDTTGKRKQAVSIKFPLAPEHSEPIDFDKVVGKPNNERMKEMAKDKLKVFSASGFIYGNGEKVADIKSKVSALAYYDASNTLNFEYRIPFSSIYYTQVNKASAEKLSVIIVVNNLSMPKMKGGSGGGMPMREGMPQGGPPMSGGVPDLEEVQQFMQSSTTVYKYTPFR